MRGLRLLVCLLFFVGQFGSFIPNAQAEDSGGVVIAQMYPGASQSTDQEFIELYNNSLSEVDVTGWCVFKYANTSSTSSTKVGCFDTFDNDTRLLLPSHGYATFTSKSFLPSEEIIVDGKFSTALSPSNGYVVIRPSIDSNIIIDSLGWGNLSDSTYASYPGQVPNGKSLTRKANDFGYIDTRNDLTGEVDNGMDFVETDPVVHSSHVYEKQVTLDMCPNMEETEIPEGYFQDSDGNCYKNVCPNLENPYKAVPDGYELNTAGDCVLIDECDNLEGIQLAIPSFMVRDGANDCIIEYSPLELTEILPNAAGSDSGNEFIEIYNTGKVSIDLTFYVLKIGLNGEKTISFPVGSVIAPGEYKSFGDSELKFTLVNSSSKVVLTAIGGKIFGNTGIYSEPDDGESWAFVNGKWQYTNRPTPGLKNLASIVVADEDDSTDSSGLKPCNPDQYRNPETNRCKKYATSTLKACREGQYRNSETNRCRNLTAASASLKPCAVGQERNPETNRCRKSQSGTVPQVGYAVEPIADTPMVFAGWWALAGVGALAGAYGAWEWRRELKGFWQRLLGLIKK